MFRLEPNDSSIDDAPSSSSVETSLAFYRWPLRPSNEVSSEETSTPHMKPNLKQPETANLWLSDLIQIGPFFACPLRVVWDTNMKRYSALVYATKVVILHYVPPRLDDQHEAQHGSLDSDLIVLHQLPLPSAIQSLLWVHQTLFIATLDEVITLFEMLMTRRTRRRKKKGLDPHHMIESMDEPRDRYLYIDDRE